MIKDLPVMGGDDVTVLPPPARCTHYEYGGNVGWLAIPASLDLGPAVIDQVFSQIMSKLREHAYKDYAALVRPETFHPCYDIEGVCTVYMMQIERMPGAETSDS